MRRPSFSIGNWKMNMSVHEAEAFMQKLPKLASSLDGHAALAVPYTLLSLVAKLAKPIKIMVGAQNVCQFEKGAYTGEISTSMIKEAGATFSLIGHSERRVIYHEDPDMIREKVRQCLRSGIKPVLCIGETLEQKTEGKTKKVLIGQLLDALENLTPEEAEKIYVAYEPVWAIGTGHAATPEMAQEVHMEIRSFFTKHFGSKVSEKTLILYGGSVNTETIESLIKMPDIDGTLIGGASLEAESFAEIINIARKIKL